MYELFEHTADLGLRARAPRPDLLFAEAARGLFAIVVANPDHVQPVQERAFRLAGEDYEYLLFDWLNELLYTFETERLLFCQFDVHLDQFLLQATARGEPVDEGRHRMDHEVKAITYHGLSVGLVNGQWSAEVIVDI